MYCKFFVVLYSNFSDDFSPAAPKDSTSFSAALLLMAFRMCVCNTLINLLSEEKRENTINIDGTQFERSGETYS